MPLPTEFVTSRAYGSMRDRSPSAVRIVKRYSAPGSTPATSADHVPLVPSPSRASAVRSPAQSSNVPVTKTACACGAQTRNDVPAPWGTAPIPGRGDGLVFVTLRMCGGVFAGDPSSRQRGGQAVEVVDREVERGHPESNDADRRARKSRRTPPWGEPPNVRSWWRKLRRIPIAVIQRQGPSMRQRAMFAIGVVAVAHPKRAVRVRLVEVDPCVLGAPTPNRRRTGHDRGRGDRRTVGWTWPKATARDGPRCPHPRAKRRSTRVEPCDTAAYGRRGGREIPASGEPPAAVCPRCGRRVDMATIGPRVGLGHCPVCEVYACRWCWAGAEDAVRSAGCPTGLRRWRREGPRPRQRRGRASRQRRGRPRRVAPRDRPRRRGRRRLPRRCGSCRGERAAGAPDPVRPPLSHHPRPRHTVACRFIACGPRGDRGRSGSRGGEPRPPAGARRQPCGRGRCLRGRRGRGRARPAGAATKPRSARRAPCRGICAPHLRPGRSCWPWRCCSSTSAWPSGRPAR